METALKLIDNGTLSLINAAKQFKIDKSALSRRRTRLLGKQGRKTSLTKEMEIDLSDKIKIMAKWGFAPTKPEIQAIVQTYVQENHLTTQFKEGKPGKDWFKNFCKRNRLSQKNAKTQVYYVAQSLKVFENDVEVKYLRRKGFKFIFPVIEEKYFIDKSDIEMKLPQPEIEKFIQKNAF
ncbi:unnamed protein product [Acanthoscelides obtectus]|uniref:HTH CENPB-type domain-containing protein n=1 Tax=Acanthoscelides obtectus TaxID=200917 RepID=A0A9P0M2H8_ACAOB|nr:unnamed protein product [Acanthoscelides obtectus]CAK1622451.1 hypothetical protein AOBTE_LOCUS1494 [Acanthoscelides obtectus]